MGHALSAPSTAKDSGDGVLPAKQLAWGHSAMQGWRMNMEDAHFAIGSLEGDGWVNTAAFGVMDGHGGKEVALFCEEHLPRQIARGSPRDVTGSLVSAFHTMDEMLSDDDLLRDTLANKASPMSSRSAFDVNPDWVGCTAVVCLVRPDVIVVANAGDSRAVLSRRRQAVPLSEDHKPNLPTERERIRKAGGAVERSQVGQIVQYRVNGNLNLSRSLGDLEYKKNERLKPSEQMICSTPDVHTFRREANDEFIILACDGIWDVLGSQDAVDFVHERLPRYLKTGRPLSGIMEEMLDHCLSPDLALTHGLGGDNMTAMLVLFTGGPAAGGHFQAYSTQAALMSTPSLTPSSAVSYSSKGLPADIEDTSIGPAGMLCGCQANAGNQTR